MDRKPNDNPTEPLRPLGGNAQSKTEAIAAEQLASSGIRYRFEPGFRFGHYQIESRLGGGGMGEVYAAMDLDSKHRLALKFPAFAGSWTPAMRRRFVREGLLAASINHPNSLYVYGTEEVDGIPVIAMELAQGGTLQDRVDAEGPLPIIEAVRAILQVIAGLQAATTAGIIHRDIKPSNCFVGHDGQVKIGDFGLSIPSEAEYESRLTNTGGVLGTPAFAPPEQLRGGEVDVRTDIYAVGATLYFLLTGQTPYRARNAAQMLAAILERSPTSPRHERPEIPEGLALAVLRCLEKKPDNRFCDYDELKRSLAPYTGKPLEPAPAVVRLAAGAIDWSVFLIMFVAFMELRPGGETSVPGPKHLLFSGTLFVATLFLYSLPDIVRGQSLGKLLLGIRVTDREGRSLPFRRAFLRFCAFAVPALTTHFIMEMAGPMGLQGLAIGLLALAAPLLPFVGLRRSAMRLGFHDRLAGADVIQVSDNAADDAGKGERQERADCSYPYAVGPFFVDRDPSTTMPDTALNGFDHSLKRRVWVHIRQVHAPSQSLARRTLSARGRLRWLNGGLTGTYTWDAYEDPGGEPLLRAVERGVRWQTVRLWLRDLSVELVPFLLEEPCRPPLRLSCIWVTSAGSAVLTDFPPPGCEGASRPEVSDLGADEAPVVAAQRFLSALANAALGGRDTNRLPLNASGAPMPPYMSRVLQTLNLRGYASEIEMIRCLEDAVRRPVSVTRRKRALQVAGLGAPVAVFLAYIGMTSIKSGSPFVGMSSLNAAAIEREHPGWVRADYCLSQLAMLDLRNATPSRDLRRKNLEIHLVSDLRSVTEDTAATRPQRVTVFEKNEVAMSGLTTRVVERMEPIFDQRARERIRVAGERWPHPQAEEVAAARVSLARELSDSGFRQRRLFRVVRFNVVSAHLILAWLAPFAFVLGVSFGGGLLLRASGIAVVTRDGKLAGRWRLMVRSAATWAVPALAQLAISLGLQFRWYPPGTSVYLWGHILPIAIFVIGGIHALRCPERGMQDQLAGTWLVPR